MKTLPHEIAGLDVDDVLYSYIEAALWSSSNSDNEDGDDSNLEGFKVSKECEDKFRAMIEKFITDNSALIEKAECQARNKAQQFGHDLWLTQNRHGCGFWEAPDWSEKEGAELTALAQKLPEIYLFINDDNLVDCDM